MLLKLWMTTNDHSSPLNHLHHFCILPANTDTQLEPQFSPGLMTKHVLNHSAAWLIPSVHSTLNKSLLCCALNVGLSG